MNSGNIFVGNSECPPSILLDLCGNNLKSSISELTEFIIQLYMKFVKVRKKFIYQELRCLNQKINMLKSVIMVFNGNYN